MGKKRKQDHDSSSSDAKRCRSCHCHNGETSRPNDGMPPQEGLSDIVRAVIKLKDVIHVKLSTEEKFKRKIQKLKEKRKKDKNKHEEDLRVLKEDLIRIFKEDHQELKSKIQEMEKEAHAEVNHYKASPSQRSQLSQSTRFRLVIENSVSRTIYKKETVETEDGGGHIKVVMYDGGNPIESDHRLASVRVELVVIEGGFDEKRGSWSKEEFEESIIKPRRTTALTSLVKNGTFNLIGGSCDHEGAIIMDNSQQREVKLGVRVTVPTETRVLEGVSNPFKVQEGKTKKPALNKMGKKPLPPVPTRNLVQPTSTHATQHGQGHFFFSKRVSPDEQHGLPPPLIQGVLQKTDRGKHSGFPTDGAAEDNRLSYPPATVPLMVEGNGLALNGNSQQSSQQIPTPNLWQPTSTHYMQHGQGSSLPPPSMPNQLQVAGYYPPLPACGQDQCTSLPNASSQVVFPNLSGYGLLDGQWNPIPGGEIFVEGVNHSNVQPPVEEHYASFRCNQVLLQWDEPHVELKKHWNFLDQLMPLYSTQSGFYRENFPSTSVMDKAHKLLASISSGDSVLKMKTSVTSRATQTPQRRGVLIRPIEPYDLDDGPPVKKQRNAKYQLRFVNRVCNDYYTREQIKSEDGKLLKVALYDDNNLVVTSGPLSSACVEVVLLHGDFNAEGHDYWTSEEFSACLVHPQSVKEAAALGGDRVLTLIDGEADLGNVNFQTSSFHARTGKFVMGIEIRNVREESVQEGITSAFLVRVRRGEGEEMAEPPFGLSLQIATTSGATKRKRRTDRIPDPDTEVVSLSPQTLLSDLYMCEICNKGFKRDQNLQLHRRGHNLPWKLKAGEAAAARKRVFVCPKPSCLHHDPSHALGDLVGIKKHFRLKHSDTATVPATAAPRPTPPTPVIADALPPESSCHQTISFKLPDVSIENPKQAAIGYMSWLECDDLIEVGASSALHDQSLQVGTVFEACRAEDPKSMVPMDFDAPSEPFGQGVEWSAPSTLLKAHKHKVVMEEENMEEESGIS